MLDLGSLDLEEIAIALADPTDCDSRWLIDPATGDVVLWTSDTGIDGHNPVDLGESSTHSNQLTLWTRPAAPPLRGLPRRKQAPGGRRWTAILAQARAAYRRASSSPAVKALT